ncbi:hypothetical protein FB561_0609 [Kribbella amoyensis]|uniref:Uncharacterized protein n=1 Tax=Kribbella amoyensis TaxID=996641 RepID=A0A561BL02_9ACTN|nr:hypothetical protein [Kribbella amoyensis]TWD79549.1 hypothetical protein FB561_0609 [Kribbella amoyensis]
MAEEAITTLRAELGRFERAEVGFALLETFLDVVGPWLGEAIIDPRRLLLPDRMTDDRAVVQGLIEELGTEPVRKQGPFTLHERPFDLADDQARWDYTRLAYCSTHAAVWSRGRRTTYFEVADRERATYWLPDSLKAQYFDRLAAHGWMIPEDWLAAVPKKPKPWWKRGRM